MRSAVFIDASFLLSVGSSTVTGTSLRAATTVQMKPLIEGLLQTTRDDSGLEPLRLYWYDASKNAVFSEEHKQIALLDDVKVRLGRIGVNGQQKGVDLRLGLDLVEVARNRAAQTAYVLTGDDDIAEAVEAAQELGMKVVLLGLDDPGRHLGLHSVAEHLALQVDRIVKIPGSLIEQTFSPAPRTRPATAPKPGPGNAPHAPGHPTPGRPGPVTPGAAPAYMPVPTDVAAKSSVLPSSVYSTSSDDAEAPAPTADKTTMLKTAADVARSAARSWYETATMHGLDEVLADRPVLPGDIDATLLRDCAAQIGDDNTGRQSVRRQLRQSFWEAIDELH
jgi:uncharacterized LabA/DUF88 family protein